MQIKRVAAKDLSPDSLRVEDNMNNPNQIDDNLDWLKQVSDVDFDKKGNLISLGGKSLKLVDFVKASMLMQEIGKRGADKDKIRQLTRMKAKVSDRKKLQGEELNFHDEDLSRLVGKLEDVCTDRFASLDLFNDDCKGVTEILHKLAIEDTDWIESFRTLQVAWHNGTIVYRESGHNSKLEWKVAPKDALPLYEAPAKIRWLASKDGLLHLLVGFVTKAIEDEQAKNKLLEQAEEQMNQHAPDCPEA